MMERPDLKSVKDKDVISYIEWLEKVADILINSSRAKTYVALRNQVDSWNDQITIRAEIDMPDPLNEGQTVKVRPGFIDLFANKDCKEFDRVWKFIEGAGELEVKMEAMRKTLLPKELEYVEKMVAGSSAEKHIRFDQK